MLNYWILDFQFCLWNCLTCRCENLIVPKVSHYCVKSPMIHIVTHLKGSTSVRFIPCCLILAKTCKIHGDFLVTVSQWNLENVLLMSVHNYLLMHSTFVTSMDSPHLWSSCKWMLVHFVWVPIHQWKIHSFTTSEFCQIPWRLTCLFKVKIIVLT